MNDEAAETAQRTEFFTGQQDHGAEDRRALDVQDLTKHFRLRGGPIGGKRAYVQAVDRISFSVSGGKRWASLANPAAESPRPRAC